MCGIFAYVGSELDAGELCFGALKHLEYRGYDSWGIAVSGQELEIKKELGKLPKIGPNMKPGTMVLGHSRWATHGGTTLANTHPHLSANGQAVIVHNGIVENYLDLKQSLSDRGHMFASETDTEVIVQLYEEARIKNDPFTAFLETIKKLSGNNALVIMDIATNTMLATKNGSPLVIGKNPMGNFLASDVMPLLEHCESIYFVDNNEILVIDAIRVSVYDLKTSRNYQPKWQRSETNFQQVDLGTHEHFLIKEISEQPEILRQLAATESAELIKLRELIRGSSDVWFTGCGTASYAGLLATYFAADSGLSARAVYAHELPMLAGSINELSTVVALSQSGETIDIIDAIDATKTRNATTAALVNVPTSSLSRMVDCVLPIKAGPEICVLSTKAFTAMVGNLHAIYSEDGSYRETLLSAANAIESMLEKEIAETIEAIAERLCAHSSVFIIGTASLYPLALEAALKIKEVSYIHAEAFPSGELKHGVIALIEEGTLCLVLAPKNEKGDRIKIHASEIRARGGKIISISAEKLACEDDYIKADFENLSYFFAALTAVQILAYKCALIKNLDPDKPRNLAKSVTVR